MIVSNSRHRLILSKFTSHNQEVRVTDEISGQECQEKGFVYQGHNGRNKGCLVKGRTAPWVSKRFKSSGSQNVQPFDFVAIKQSSENVIQRGKWQGIKQGPHMIPEPFATAFLFQHGLE
jgi:hypothetical protein